MAVQEVNKITFKGMVLLSAVREECSEEGEVGIARLQSEACIAFLRGVQSDCLPYLDCLCTAALMLSILFGALCVTCWRSCIVPIVLHAHNKLDNHVETQANSSGRYRNPRYGKKSDCNDAEEKIAKLELPRSICFRHKSLTSHISASPQAPGGEYPAAVLTQRCLSRTSVLNIRAAKEYLPTVAIIPPKRVQNRVRKELLTYILPQHIIRSP